MLLNLFRTLCSFCNLLKATTYFEIQKKVNCIYGNYNPISKDLFQHFVDISGEGQFGKVYSAVNMDTGELMAMKEVDLCYYSCV